MYLTDIMELPNVLVGKILTKGNYLLSQSRCGENTKKGVQVLAGKRNISHGWRECRELARFNNLPLRNPCAVT